MEHEIIGTGLDKTLLETIEFKMAKGYSKDRILRLMILLSVTEGGLKEATYKALVKIFVECYGVEELNSILNAEDMGLLKKKSGRFDWTKIKNAFDLINEEVRV